jgi:carbon-monoxide dehydrogenase iron sulfur subunit
MSKPRHEFVSCDPDKCVGCRICEYLCAAEKDKVFNPLRSRIRAVRIYPTINLAIACRTCEDAPCVISCPRDALEQSDSTGLILVDEEKCNGCGWCIEACDFGAITLDPEKRIVNVCDLCSTREDKKPQCVEWCPEEALERTNRDILALKARLDSTKKLLKAALAAT